MRRAIDRRTTLLWAAALLGLALGGCGGLGATPGPTIGPTPTPGPAMTAGDLRFFLIESLGPRWYCDPDSYPVGRDEQQSAIEHYAEIKADPAFFAAAAGRAGVDPAAPHGDADKLAIWRQWKMAASIPLDPIGNGRYRFDYLAEPAAGADQGKRTGGIIDEHGTITVEQEALAGEPMCPICLDRLTRIDTPTGAIEVDRLRLGDPVWTLDRTGRRVAGTVVALGSMAAPPDHGVIRVTLADGRTVSASPGHPLPDGRAFAGLRLGESVDGSAVVGLERVAYQGGETFDLGVSGETGIYLAGG